MKRRKKPGAHFQAESEWCYMLTWRSSRHIPHRNTVGHIRAALSMNGLNEAQIAQIVEKINNGHSYTPPKGKILNIHIIKPLVSQLREIAATITHSGRLGICWWHADLGLVKWSADAMDSLERFTSPDDIRNRFISLKGVRGVEIVVDAGPILGRQIGWEEICYGSHAPSEDQLEPVKENYVEQEEKAQETS